MSSMRVDGQFLQIRLERGECPTAWVLTITFQVVVVQHCIQEGRQMVAVEEADH